MSLMSWLNIIYHVEKISANTEKQYQVFAEGAHTPVAQSSSQI